MREPINLSEIEKAMSDVRVFLENKIKEKGNLSFASIHEISGVLDEEFDELKESIHLNDYNQVEIELKDVIISAFWGLVSLQTRKIDW